MSTVNPAQPTDPTDPADPVGRGRSRAAADRLLEVATPGLYRRNPFRITGIPTDASSRLVRQRRQVAEAHRFGGTAVTGDGLLPLPEAPAPDQARAAFDELNNIEHRLVDEVFWWWGEPGACGCPDEVHELHDGAVRAHAAVLDMEESAHIPARRRSEQWREAARCWFEALDDGRLWDHLRHRARTLPDRRVDESTVDGLREQLPRALLRPQVTLAAAAAEPARLVGLLDSWDFHPTLLDDERNRAVDAACDRVESVLDELNVLRNASRHAEAAQFATDELVPVAHRLDELAKDHRLRRVSTVRNVTAVVANNCAMTLRDETDLSASPLITTLLDQAIDLAVEPNSRRIIQGNIDLCREPAAPTSTARRVTNDHRFQKGRDRIVALIEQERRVAAAKMLLNWLSMTNVMPASELAWAQNMLRSIPQDEIDEAQRARTADSVGYLLGWATWFDYSATVMLVLLGLGVPGVWTGLVLALTAAVPATIVSRYYLDGKALVSRSLGWLSLLVSMIYLVTMGAAFGWDVLAICLAGLAVGAIPGALLGDTLAGRK